MLESFSRTQLSIPGLLRQARQVFAAIPGKPNYDIPLEDHLMAGLAVFGLNYPSLLQFDKDRRQETTPANLRSPERAA